MDFDIESKYEKMGRGWGEGAWWGRVSDFGQRKNPSWAGRWGGGG